MAIHGSEFWGLHLIGTMIAAYAVVLFVALAYVGLRRLVGRNGGQEAARSARPSGPIGGKSAIR